MTDKEGCLGLIGICVAGSLIGDALGNWQLGLGIPVLAISILFLVAALQKKKEEE